MDASSAYQHTPLQAHSFPTVLFSRLQPKNKNIIKQAELNRGATEKNVQKHCNAHIQIHHSKQQQTVKEISR